MGRHGGHVTKRGVLWEDMVDTWTRNKERSPMGRHGGHVVTSQREESYGKTWWTRGHVTKRGVLWEDMVDTLHIHNMRNRF